MATRRKRSRGGRSGARAGGPPTSNALEWAERLARGEEPPQPSALEWAESLGQAKEQQEPAASTPWTSTPAETSPASPSPFGITATDAGPAHDTAAAGPAAPFGAAAHVSAGTAAEDDTAPGWGPVKSEPPVRRSRRARGSKGADAKGSRKSRADKPDRGGRRSTADPSRRAGQDPVRGPEPVGPGAATGQMDPLSGTPEALSGGLSGTPGPFGGGDPDAAIGAGPPPQLGTTQDPAPDKPAAPLRSRRSARAEKDPAGGRATRRSAPGKPGRRSGAASSAAAPGNGPENRAGRAGTRPQGRSATTGAAKPSGKRVRRILAKGLPKSADRPTVLIVAAVVAVALGLGVGWTTNYFGSGKNLAAATPQQCAAAQTAWTKAANAQTGISEDEPASVRAGFIEARDAMASVDVPEGIAEDWQAAQAFYTTVADALEAEKAGDAEGIAEAAQIASTQVDTDDMIETSKRITRYVNADCNA